MAWRPNWTCSDVAKIKRRRWTPAEDEQVLECAVSQRRRLARELGRTVNAITLRHGRLQRDRLVGLETFGHRPRNRPWTGPALRRLDDLRSSGLTWVAIGRQLGRTPLAVRTQWSARHPTGRRWWSRAEDRKLIELWSEPMSVLTKEFGRDAVSISNRGCALRRKGIELADRRDIERAARATRCAAGTGFA